MFDSTGSLGSVFVETTNGRGFSAEEWTERLLAKLIHIADTTPPAIKDQAIAFRDAMRPVILYYMKQAINSDRTTVAGKLREAGHSDMADLIGRL
jgi:hypothetical protein